MTRPRSMQGGLTWRFDEKSSFLYISGPCQSLLAAGCPPSWLNCPNGFRSLYYGYLLKDAIDVFIKLARPESAEVRIWYRERLELIPDWAAKIVDPPDEKSHAVEVKDAAHEYCIGLTRRAPKPFADFMITACDPLWNTGRFVGDSSGEPA
jgi:hypothetical protein